MAITTETLNEIRKNPGINNSDLARRMNLSRKAVQGRLKKIDSQIVIVKGLRGAKQLYDKAYANKHGIKPSVEKEPLARRFDRLMKPSMDF